MKQCLLFVLLAAVTSFSYSQQTGNKFNKLYAELQAGGVNHAGTFAGLGARAVLPNNWTYGLSFQGFGMDPHNLPADYRPTMGLLLIIPYSEGNPSVDMSIISATAGRFLPMGKKFWLNAGAGLSVVTGSEFRFARRAESRSSIFEFPSNYTYVEERKTTVGAMLQADINWGISRVIGLGAGAFANLNSIQSPVGYQIKLLVGKMNTRH
jgi:hypothetical protein